MKPLKKKIEVELLEEAEIYFLALNDKIQAKFLRAFDKTESGLKGPWFEKLNSKDGIFEFKEETKKSFIEFLRFGMETLNLKH